MILVIASLGATELMKNISFIISLPLHTSHGSETSRNVGLEILPGADIAVNGINEDSAILSNYTLQQILIDSGSSSLLIYCFTNLIITLLALQDL